MTTLAIVAGFISSVGHLMLWVAVVNRLHATNWSPTRLKLIQLPIGLFVLAGPWLVYQATAAGRSADMGVSPTHTPVSPQSLLAIAYAAVCLAVFGEISARWWRRRNRRTPAALVEATHDRRDIRRDLQRPLAGDWMGQLCAALPGNELYQLDVVDKQLVLPSLPRELDGLTITHLSDLHFTGRVDRAFFDEAVRRANDWQPDIAVVTGDILDTWECSDWLPRTLGQLRAREGVWFILGNHDLRPGRVADLRRMLTELGLTDLGGQCRVMTVRGIEVLVAGNECPWFEPAPLVPLPAESPRPFRLLLSHTPDQWEWARRHQFDLMLAGHTHGGQICFPLLGPIVAPSRYGVEYAGGLFEFGSLVMHVSRGLSAEEPLRWRCPPELPRLILRADNG